MSKWYLAKENWPNISNIAAKHGREYIGLGGCIWPRSADVNVVTIDAYAQLEKSKSYTEIECNESSIYVHAPTALAPVIAYLDAPGVQQKNPVLTEVCHALDMSHADIDGYDFGNPGGGYSVIETEIILKDSRETIDKYLNEFGLFGNLTLMQDFLYGLEDSVRRGECEELDNYVPVAVKKIGLVEVVKFIHRLD